MSTLLHNAYGYRGYPFVNKEKRHLTRREFLRRSGLLGLGAFFGLPSCETFFHSSPYLIFQQLDSGCTSVEESASLQGGQGKIVFSGVMSTPNPCYDLQSELVVLRCSSAERCPRSYEVAITTKAQEGETLIRQPLHVLRESAIAAPEPWGCPMSHRSVQCPSRKSRNASSAS